MCQKGYTVDLIPAHIPGHSASIERKSPVWQKNESSVSDYYLSKKSCPFVYSGYIMKIERDFLDYGIG